MQLNCLKCFLRDGSYSFSFGSPGKHHRCKACGNLLIEEQEYLRAVQEWITKNKNKPIQLNHSNGIIAVRLGLCPLCCLPPHGTTDSYLTCGAHDFEQSCFFTQLSIEPTVWNILSEQARLARVHVQLCGSIKQVTR